jgi:hypothetical protein
MRLNTSEAFELLLELSHLGAFGFGNFFELPRLSLPTGALGFDDLESMREDVELLLDPILRRALPLELFVEIRRTSFRIAERVLQKGECLFG